ncbi:unnamed protein product [Heligmosomoides polygyrus]|uniref:Uncharacterized protein n=1 Tax=Heligmosomoides polygyrus TaxID=6339 RepID=A0A183FUV0_HELPZ|nr:unnamed protein product [Heligmosomoides polygyrus]
MHIKLQDEQNDRQRTLENEVRRTLFQIQCSHSELRNANPLSSALLLPGRGDVIAENEIMEELQIDDAVVNNVADDDAGERVEVDLHAEEEGLDARENAGDVANEVQQDCTDASRAPKGRAR